MFDSVRNKIYLKLKKSGLIESKQNIFLAFTFLYINKQYKYINMIINKIATNVEKL